MWFRFLVRYYSVRKNGSWWEIKCALSRRPPWTIIFKTTTWQLTTWAKPYFMQSLSAGCSAMEIIYLTSICSPAPIQSWFRQSVRIKISAHMKKQVLCRFVFEQKINTMPKQVYHLSCLNGIILLNLNL